MSFFEQKPKSTKKLIQNPEISQVAQTTRTNITTDTITEINSSMTAISSGITNKEALKDKIHDIHNYLRNHGAGYGMNALKVFNILYGLKKIEDKGLHESVGLSDESRFSNLLNLANKNKDEEIASLIFGGVLTSISESSIKYLLFYEIPENIKGSVFTHLIKEIDKVAEIEVSCNVLLSGKIYEYFIGRDESAIRELGAYFTDRHIVDYIYDKLEPKMCENGTIHSMIDMFGGSGGFTTGYINHLNLKYPELIKWETELNKIYHYDMNEDVIKSAGLEFFCLSGVLPDITNLKYKNSFTDEFIDEATNASRKYHYVMTNPPYGGDKIKKTEAQKKNGKIKVHIKKELPSILDEDVKKRRHNQLKNIEMVEKQEKSDNDKSKVSIPMCSGRIQRFAKENCLNGNDKEACSLILMMDLLEIGGTSIGVLKEGVFFDSSYKNLRKCLITNFNVREVISVPKDQFENTAVNTSIVIFDNIEAKTSEIKFIELLVNKHEEDVFDEINGEIFLVENKGDINGVVEKLVSVASVDELLKNFKYSLNGKDYIKDEAGINKDFEFKKISDICEFLSKSKRGASFANNEGIYDFYTSSPKVKKCNTADYDGEYIVIGTGGNSCIHLTNGKFSCSADTFILKPNSTSVPCKYIHYGLLSRWDKLISQMYGSTINHINKEMMSGFEICIPKTNNEIQLWVTRISKPCNDKLERQSRIIELEKIIQSRIREISLTEECDDTELGSICKLDNGFAFKPDDYMETGVKIISIKHIPTFNPTTSNFVTEDKKYDKYLIHHNDLLIALTGNTGKFALYTGNEKAYLNQRVCKMSLNNSLLTYYLFHMFSVIDFQKKVTLLSDGSLQANISSTTVEKIMLKIPKNKQLITDMNFMFNEIETLQTEIKKDEKLYKQYIQELDNETKQSNIIANNEESNVVIIEQVQEPIIKIRKIKKKITV